MDLQVQYNGISLTPTPLVSQSQQFLDYPQRWGTVTQIELNGYLTGLSSSVGSGISGFTSNFLSQFSTLTVGEVGGATLYSWSNVIVDEISFSNNHFAEGAMVPYSMKLRSFNVPSGVVEPSSEYVFNQGDDGVVTVNHKVSARGIKTVTGALFNAINFVRTLTGINPFAPAFIPNGTGVQTSLAETIDRAAGIYTVNEVWKYNTGVNQPYVETIGLTITDAADADYLTFDAAWRLEGSAVKDNLSVVENALFTTAPSIASRIAGLGYVTGFMAQTALSVTRDTGAAVIDIKGAFLSGYSSSDVNGFFDYIVTLENDLTMPRAIWKVEGEFFCKGPFAYRTQQLNSFKTTNSSNWRSYLSGLITSAPIYTTYHTGGNTLSSQTLVSIIENTGQALLKLSMTMNEGADRLGSNQKYTVDVSPARWNFELLPSANIEGHYVVQDPQMQSRARITIGVSADSLAPGALVSTASGIINELATIYVTSGFVTSENLTTGETDIAYSKEWIGVDYQSVNSLFTKVVGSTSNDFVRQPGFKFGY
jgi:hypothetical protein